MVTASVKKWVFGIRQSKWSNKCPERAGYYQLANLVFSPRQVQVFHGPKEPTTPVHRRTVPLSSVWGPSSNQQYLRDLYITLITMRGKNQAYQTVSSNTEPTNSEELQSLHSYLSWESQAFAVTPPCWNDSCQWCFLSCLLLSPSRRGSEWSSASLISCVCEDRNIQAAELSPMGLTADSITTHGIQFSKLRINDIHFQAVPTHGSISYSCWLSPVPWPSSRGCKTRVKISLQPNQLYPDSRSEAE